MRLSSFLKPHFARFYADRPSITTDEVAEAIVLIVEGNPQLDGYRRELMKRGVATEWGGFYGRLRQAAYRQVKRAAIKRTPMGDVIELALQAKLPLPDPYLSPVLADCTLIMVRESIRYMRQHRQGLTSQIAFHEAAAAQLAAATLRVGNPDLTMGDANEAGLIDWSRLAAA